MELRTLLRAAAIVGGLIWGFLILKGWYAYGEMKSFYGALPVVGEVKNSLLWQTIVDIGLLAFGMFGGGKSPQHAAVAVQSAPIANNVDVGEMEVENGYTGDANLNNDSYQIYLVKKYKIEKNEVLNKFVYNEKLYETVEDALSSAHEQESLTANELAVKHEAERIKVAELEEERLKREQEWTANAPERAKQRKSFLVKLSIAIAGIVIVVAGYKEVHRRQYDAGVFLIEKTTLGAGVPTANYNKELQSAGWEYLRDYQAELRSMKEYIEYRNEKYPNKIIRVLKDGCNVNAPSVNSKVCANHPSFYEEYIGSEFIQKSVADAEYRSPPLVNAIIIDVGLRPGARLEELRSEIEKTNIMRNQLQNYSVGSMGGKNLDGNTTEFIYIGFFPNKQSADEYLSSFKQYGDAYLGFVDW